MTAGQPGVRSAVAEVREPRFGSGVSDGEPQARRAQPLVRARQRVVIQRLDPESVALWPNGPASKVTLETFRGGAGTYTYVRPGTFGCCTMMPPLRNLAMAASTAALGG